MITFPYEVWASVEEGHYCLARHSQMSFIFGPGKLPFGAAHLATFHAPDDATAVWVYQQYVAALNGGCIPDGLDDHTFQLPVYSQFTPAEVEEIQNR